MAERQRPRVRLGALVFGLAYIALGVGALVSTSGWAEPDAGLVVAGALLVAGMAALITLLAGLRSREA